MPQDPSGPTSRLDEFNYRYEDLSAAGATWCGYTGPGLLVMSNIERFADSQTPPISEVSKAVYERAFGINSLKYVIFQNVQKKQTKGFINEILYTKERLGYT